MLPRVIIVLLFLLLSSCAGQRVRYFTNPFLEYGIKTVHIRPIENNSHYPFIGNSLTTSIYKLFRKYDGLEVKITHDLNADAVVVGSIFQTHRKYIKSLLSQSTSDFYTENDASISDSIGDRDDFVVKQTGQIDLDLKLVMLLKPSNEDIQYALRSSNKKSIPSVRYVFSEHFDLTSAINYSIRATHGTDKLYNVDLGGVVNYTNSKYSSDRALDALVDSFSASLENRVFNVF